MDAVSVKKRKIRLWPKKRLSHRSRAVDAVIFIFLGIGAVFMGLPLVYSITLSLKPLDELWVFPPTLFPQNPTLKNYSDLFTIMSNSLVPFSKYIFNTVFITGIGTLLHVIIASMCAYGLAKFEFKGKNLLFHMVVLSLMFSGAVTSIPNFMIMRYLGLIDSQLSIIIPAIGSTLGLYLMKQFMEQLPDSILEAARVEGATEVKLFWKIVMPMVKPAWLTLIVFSVQSLWNIGQSIFIYREEQKPLGYALSQIASAGIARAGVGAAVIVVMMSVPIITFIITQSGIIETMSSSGLKE
ncbi:MAG TPA: carbohydrate ABC transporter permease [Lachnospiraceae bacterium]|jgi:ABC-type glycerol-3-phosphate transport system permease component|nr:carbohydrate ABC transporter permease [Lachnospiraceae bacterium]